MTRSHTQDTAIADGRDLYRAGLTLLGQLDLSRPVRLLGLAVSGLEEASMPRQLELGDTEGWAKVGQAVAEIRERFGDTAVAPARLIEAPVPDDSTIPDE
jgi:DNA polymerase-4